MKDTNKTKLPLAQATTGPEILTDFSGKRLDYWVTGYGTGGTFNGAGRALKKERPDIKIVLAEPEDAGLLASGIKTERNPDGAPASSHPAFKAHPIQGWTPDFIPKVRFISLLLVLSLSLPLSCSLSLAHSLSLSHSLSPNTHGHSTH